MNVTFRQLKVFCEVARLGSMARAAETLHLTPPAVSMQVKELEAQVGLLLFDREGRQVSLSTAGEYFLVHAKKLLGNLKDADNAMARFKKLETGLLTVGMVSTAKYFVPRMLAAFRRDNPGIDVRLMVTANRSALVTLLQSGEIDLAVMGRPPTELATRAEAFAAHPMVLVAPPGHPLLRVGQAPVAALEPYTFIVREHGSGTRSAMERFFAEHRFEPRITMEMSSNETIKQAVMAEMGLSFLSLHTVGLELSNNLLALLDVEHTPVMRMWNVVHLQSKVLSPSAEAFRYFMIEHGEAHLRAHDEPLLAGKALAAR
jgi:LysR family transcriptional regulator, low CO2-responsive transcriptional regulator